MFSKILVANRGEIAARIFLACRELSIRSVAVYSDVDRSAPWARVADEGYSLAGSSASETYLNQQAIFEVARKSGCEAIHPGYGFLSENADFAEACAKEGFVFIGPSPESMRLLGSKSGARSLAARVGVPVIPGLDGQGLDDAEMAKAASSLGFPVLIKASAGGGGKGMRLVDGENGFADALAAARNESLSSFGSDHLLLEKYFEGVRHIEVQILGDEHGHVIHLFERECSLQRRHQKIVEESPAPRLDASLRDSICAAAVRLASEANYSSAGTIEFLLTEDGKYFFLEMNTRLQVEHPVTEMTTGIDIASWQIRLAAGERLTVDQEAVRPVGHAIECRVYAEEPANDFLPSTGEIAFYLPPSGPGVRVDSGIAIGTTVSPYYDPMMLKVISHGADRAEATRRIKTALQDTVVLGVRNNIEFLVDLLGHERFVDGQVSTSFIDNDFLPWVGGSNSSESSWIAAAAAELLQKKRGVTRPESGKRAEGSDFNSPWLTSHEWRLTYRD